MQLTLAPVIAVPIAVVAALAACGIWYVLLRPVPPRTEPGVIESSVLVDTYEVERTRVSSVRNPTMMMREERYTVPRHFLHTVRLADGTRLQFVENLTPGGSNSMHGAGERVSVTYTTRRIPFRENKTLVSDVQPRSRDVTVPHRFIP